MVHLSRENSPLYSALHFILYLLKYQLLQLDEKFEFSHHSKEKYEKLRKEALFIRNLYNIHLHCPSLGLADVINYTYFYKQSIFDPRTKNCLSFSEKLP